MNLELTVDPSWLSTAQQKGERVVGRHIFHYGKPQVRRSQQLLEQALVAAWKRAGGKTARTCVKGKPKEIAIPFLLAHQPAAVMVEFRFPFTANTPQSRRRWNGQPSWMSVRPDADNLLKGLLDAMTAVHILHDDAQVVWLTACKTRAELPCINVGITTAD